MIFETSALGYFRKLLICSPDMIKLTHIVKLVFPPCNFSKKKLMLHNLNENRGSNCFKNPIEKIHMVTITRDQTRLRLPEIAQAKQNL